MRIGGTMLTGGNRESVIGDAILSADKHVDGWVFIDTGPSAKLALEVACGIVAPKRRHIVEYPGEFDACYKGRNFGLDEAHRLGYDWALVLDTDERLIVRDCVSVKAILESTQGNTINCWDDGRHYTKERFIELPAVARYAGTVHEGYDGPEVKRDATDLIYFRELPKSKEEEDVRTAIVLENCLRDLEMNPDGFRQHFYAAQAMAYFARYDEAIRHYEAYAARTPYEHEWGWAIFRIASCHNWAGNLDGAIEYCAKGLVKCPYMVEFYWMASFCELKKGNPINALAWADAGIMLGKTMAHRSPRPVRICFQLPESEFEGCWEHRREALIALGGTGFDADIKFAHEMAEKAKRKRIGQ